MCGENHHDDHPLSQTDSQPSHLSSTEVQLSLKSEAVAKQYVLKEVPEDNVTNPHYLANHFMRLRSGPEGTPRRIHWWREQFVEYKGGGYEVVAFDDIKSDVVKSIRQVFIKYAIQKMKARKNGDEGKNNSVKTISVTGSIVNNTLTALKSEISLPSDTEPPCWLGLHGITPEKSRSKQLLAMKNGVLDLDCLLHGGKQPLSAAIA